MATTSSVAESTPGGGPNICHTCSEQISTAQFIRVGAYKFHKDHFTCCECHTSLHGKKFHHKEGKFYCAQDYVEKFCHTCRHCKQKIATGSVIQAFGGYYHPEHFVCKTCSKPFPNGKYYESGDEPYCIAEGSVVSTAYGTSVAIECASALPALLTLDAKSGELVHASPSRHLNRGVKACVELQFHDGRTLVCTPDHRMRTADGAWMHAADMQEQCTAVFASAVAPVASAHEDESAASPHAALSLSSPADRERALALLRLAGYFAFDATFPADKLNALDRDALTHDLQLSSADAELAASSFALPPSVAAALAQLRVPSAESLPSFLLAADCPLSLVREFLASCFGRYAAALSLDCVGLTLPLPSEAVAQQLQCVLARFGVASACIDRALVLSLSSLLPFTDSIGFRYASHAAQRLALAASYQRSLLAFKSSSPPSSFAAFLSECGPSAVHLFSAASCPSAPVLPFSLRLVSRRAVGDRRVYDLSVPSSSAFFAGGLLVHNCDEHYFLITAEKCASCSLGVKESDMVRVQGKVFHQACLSCCHCGLPLAKKGAIFQKDGMVYCRSDYLNFFCKRCTACANHILKHCVSVNDEFYHPECLQCSYCKKVLSKYICISGNLRCNDHTENAVDPVKCTQCQLVIQGEVVLSVGQKLHQDCFKCGFCKKGLAKATAKLKDDKLCCPECMLKKDPNLLARNAAAAAAGGYEDDAAASLAVAPAAPAAGAGAGSSKASTAAASAQSPQPEVSDWNVYVDPKKRAGSRVAKPQSRAAGEKIEWKKGELIGKGSFGKVYMAMNAQTGELIAVKQVRLNTAEEQEQAAAIQNEIGLMENLRHPNIVSLLGTQRNGNKLNILMEYVPGKCWGRGTQMMRADGSIIAVEDIKVGMQLMGDDCTPRTVQPRSIVHGVGEMFEIQLESREAWRCNAEHILVLRMADDSSQAEVEMSVAEFLKLEPEAQKQARMFAVNPAEHGVGVDAVPAAVSAKACASSPFTLASVGAGEYFGFALDGNRRCLLADGTVTHNSLDSLLEKFGGFSEKVIRSYTKQLLEALMYCHGNRVVHRDIKGKNILIDTKGNLKLADFGSAKRFTNVMSKDAPSLSYNYTPLWTAPEVLVGDYNSKVDIWSLGCVIIEMASAKPPWSEQNFENPFRALYHIGNSDSIPKIPDTLSEVGVAFVKQCLRRNPDERPDAATLLKMDWLSGIEALPNTSDDSGSDGEEDGGIKSGSESD